MALRLDLDGATEPLPALDRLLEDPRLRPVGLVGGFTLVVVGAALQLPPVTGFWSSVVSGVATFLGVPLFCLGIAGVEPEHVADPFRLGVDLDPVQRRLVGVGAVLVVTAPVLTGLLGPFSGFALWVVIPAAALAVVGSVCMLTGFVAWTSKTLAETTPSR